MAGRDKNKYTTANVVGLLPAICAGRQMYLQIVNQGGKA